MTRTDHAVIGALVLVLAVVTAAIGAPAIAPSATPAPTIARPEVVPYREGILGRPVSVNPLAARSQVDRDLVALLFEGLVRIGPGGAHVPGLAASWTSDVTAKSWTFELRPNARWHDGTPVTADDVVFTIRTLNDPDYRGPGAGSWREVSASAVGASTVRLDLTTPLGGFLDLATQPIAPRHLLAEVPVELLADDPFGRAPIGSGPFALVALDDEGAVLEPAATVAAPAIDDASPDAGTTPLPTDTIATPAPTVRPDVATPHLTRLEFHFFDRAEDLAMAFADGRLDVASGLTAASADELADAVDGARLLRYPGTTLTGIALNLRPSHPELRDERVRAALLAAIDREAIVRDVFAGAAVRADALIPPSSWAFDAASSPVVAHDPNAAVKALTAVGWTRVDDRWRPPGATAAYTLELVTSEATTTPVLRAAAEAVAEDWTAIGFTVRVVEVDPAELVVDRLQPGEFTAAALDIAIGHDPDLYPLLASTQTQTGGLNVGGIQDPALDALLVAARQPGADEARRTAYAALQARLRDGRYLLPVAWADEVVVVRDTLRGPVLREVADRSERFWDVLTWRLAEDR